MEMMNDQKFGQMVLDEGIAEFRQEVQTFVDIGLSRLADDLSHGMVPMRGKWPGCPYSYRLGAPGSCSETAGGNTGTMFTIAWDEGLIGTAILKQLVEEERDRRARVRAEWDAVVGS